MNDCFVRCIPFPNGKSTAFTMKDSDGNYNIYVDDSLPLPRQISSYEHELSHIKNGDYDNIGDIQDIERWRHNV